MQRQPLSYSTPRRERRPTRIAIAIVALIAMFQMVAGACVAFAVVKTVWAGTVGWRDANEIAYVVIGGPTSLALFVLGVVLMRRTLRHLRGAVIASDDSEECRVDRAGAGNDADPS